MLPSFQLDKSLADHIIGNLARFNAIEINRDGRNHAAVAFTLVDCSEPAAIANIPFDADNCAQAAYILTTRAAQLSRHAGQRAYPGGRVDPGETAAQAALRELEEEVGLRLGADAVLGQLDDYATHSGFVITPLVLWGRRGVKLTPNPGEVAEIHRIPLPELLRDEVPILQPAPASEHPVLMMPIGDDWFAAPSAAIAYQFREVALLGRHTRVAHFEQPLFARQ